jgi:hypothetical protein
VIILEEIEEGALLLTVSQVEDCGTGGKRADGDEDRVAGLIGDEQMVITGID